MNIGYDGDTEYLARNKENGVVKWKKLSEGYSVSDEIALYSPIHSNIYFSTTDRYKIHKDVEVVHIKTKNTMNIVIGSDQPFLTTHSTKYAKQKPTPSELYRDGYTLIPQYDLGLGINITPTLSEIKPKNDINIPLQVWVYKHATLDYGKQTASITIKQPEYRELFISHLADTPYVEEGLDFIFKPPVFTKDLQESFGIFLSGGQKSKLYKHLGDLNLHTSEDADYIQFIYNTTQYNPNHMVIG